MPGNVDSVILELQAKLGTYNQDVAGAANATERSMQRIQRSASTTEKAVGQAFNNTRISQQILMRVARGVTDQFAMGAPPMMIFTSHLGEIAEAGTFAGGALGKVGAFLGSGWGIALTLAANALLPMIANLFKTGDTVDSLVAKLQEHYRKTLDDERAQALFSHTLEGETQATEDNAKAIANLNLVHQSAAEKALIDAEAVAKNTIQTEKNTIAKLNNAKAAAQLLIQSTAKGSGVEGAGAQAAGIQAAEAQIAAIDDQLRQLGSDLNEQSKNITEAHADLLVERANASQEDKINRAYDQRIDAAKKLAVQEGKVGDELTKQVDTINKARQADLDRLKQAGGSHLSNAQSGRDLTFAQAQAIAEGAGLHVTSAYRSASHQASLYNDPRVNRPGNPVAVPGTSAHEGVNGRWALDIGLGPGVTPELLRKVFAAQGVTLSKVFKEAGHYHIEGQRSQDDVDAEKAANAEQKQAESVQQQYETTARRLDLEQQLAALRATGLEEDAKKADYLEADAAIESQNPGLVNSTNKAYRDQLETLKQIAHASIDAAYDRKDAADAAKQQTEDMHKLGAIAMENLKEQQQAEDQLQQRREDQVRTLAGLYTDLFTNGTKGIWDDFKHIGMEVIAEVLARLTISGISGNGFSLGGAFLSAIGHVLPGFGSSGGGDISIPGAAGGGSMVLGGNSGTDNNMLSMNGKPLVRVSAGETLSISNARAAGGYGAGGAPPVVRIEVAEGQMFEPRVTQISGQVSVQVVQAARPALTQAAVAETFRQGGRPRL